MPPPLPFLPDDILAEIVSLIAPPPPLSMSPSPPSLLSDVLERWRPPNRSREDLTSFWMTCKRFKALADRALYSYILIQDRTECLAFAQQLKAWTEAGSLTPSLVVGLALEGRSQTLGSSTVEGNHPVCYILESLPNLVSLDLGGQMKTISEVLLQLVLRPLPLRSLAGVGVSSSNYDAVARIISSTSATLQDLSVVNTASLKAVTDRTDPPSIDLPNLLRLNIVPFPQEEAEAPLEAPVAEVWGLPNLRVLAIGLESDQSMGEGGNLVSLLDAFACSVEEVTLPMWTIIDRSALHSQLVEVPRVQVLAFHLSNDTLWLKPENELEDDWKGITSVRSVIFVQDSSTAQMEDEMEAKILCLLTRCLSTETLPSLVRVYYLTEERGGSVWNLWARLSLDLVKRGIDVIYL